MPTYKLFVQGMKCAACVSKIESGLLAVEGVSQANVNLVSHRVLVTGDVPLKVVVKKLKSLGFPARESQDPESLARSYTLLKWRTVVAGVGTGALLLLPHEFVVARWAVALAVAVFSGGPVFLSALRMLFAGQLTMDSLIALGTFSGWC